MNRDLKKLRGENMMRKSGERAFQTEETVSAKVLRQECTWNNQDTCVAGAMCGRRWGWRDNWRLKGPCSHSKTFDLSSESAKRHWRFLVEKSHFSTPAVWKIDSASARIEAGRAIAIMHVREGGTQARGAQGEGRSS